MRYQYQQALIYTLIALVMFVIGYRRQETALFVGAIVLCLVSFYWLFREKIKGYAIARRKLSKR